MPRRSTIAIILVLFVANALYYYWIMARTFVIPSIDGPFYYIQVNSILHTGTIVYQDPPLTFYVFTLFTLAARNTVVGVMAGSAAFAAAASVAVYMLFKRMFKSNVPAIAAAVVCALSAEHIAMATNVMKNSFGVVFIVGAIFFLQRILDADKPAKWNVVGAVGFFLLAMFTHVLDQGIVLIFMAFYLVLSLLFADRRKLLFRYGTILLLAIGVSVAGFLLLPEYFGTFQKGLDFLSIVSASGATASNAGGVGAGVAVYDPLLYVTLILGVALSVYEWFRGDRKKLVLLVSATAVGILLVLPFIPSDFAWRFELMELIPVSIITGYAFAAIRGKEELLTALAVLVLIVPVAVVGFQSGTTLTPSISQQAYADLVHMSTLVSTNHAVLLVNAAGANSEYWPEYVLNLQVVSNSTTWLQKGYTVYELVGGQSQGGAQNTLNGGFGGGPNGSNPGAPGQQNNIPGTPGGGAPTNGATGNQNAETLNLTNATLVYSGNTYTLYKLGNSTK